MEGSGQHSRNPTIRGQEETALEAGAAANRLTLNPWATMNAARSISGSGSGIFKGACCPWATEIGNSTRTHAAAMTFLVATIFGEREWAFKTEVGRTRAV
jgi:hypothetical protein